VWGRAGAGLLQQRGGIQIQGVGVLRPLEVHPPVLVARVRQFKDLRTGGGVFKDARSTRVPKLL
jgi:hypothetical protein